MPDQASQRKKQGLLQGWKTITHAEYVKAMADAGLDRPALEITEVTLSPNFRFGGLTPGRPSIEAFRQTVSYESLRLAGMKFPCL